MALRDAKFNKECAEKARKGEMLTTRNGEQKSYKTLLEQFNYSCYPNEDGTLKGTTKPADSVGMDIDFDEAEKGKIPEVAERILAKKDEIGLLMLERSATKGLHLVFKRRAELDQEGNLRWASERLGVPFDEAAKDVTRVFFTPDSGSVLFIDEKLFERKTAPNPPFPHTRRLSISDFPSPSTGEGSGLGVLSYLNIPYSTIIDKYWELHNHGMKPITSNRDMLTFELALNLRHICGFDEELMDKVIPCYDGFPEEQKMKCIRSALGEKRTQMPRKLREVLEALRKEAMSPVAGKDGAQRISAIDEIDEQNNMYYYDNMPKVVMVQGIKDSIEAAGRVLTMPAVFAACPCIAANATNVELEVHGKFNFLGLNIFIAGEAASNKGQMDDIVRAWCSHQIMMARMYNDQWLEWRNKMKLAKNKKEQPVEPTLPKEWITLNNTTANLAEELSRVDGRHAISFTQEADVVVQKWKQNVSDFSTMLRIAWDASSYDREARSVDAVNVHIERLKWNVVMCGTPDALYRVVGNNGCRDGFQTRLCVAMTPDNTYSRLDDKPAKMTPIQKERIEQVAALLRLMSGRLVLPELEKKGREWLEEVRIHTMMNDDKTMARQRFRICVNAQRMTCCLILAAVCDKLIRKNGVQGAENVMKQSPELWMDMAKKMQTQAFLKVFDLIADYLMDTTLYFFRSRIEAGVAADDYNPKGQKNAGSRSRKGKNDTIFGLLGDTFTANDAFMQSAAIKGAGVTQNAVDMMLRNWIKQELVVEKDGRYVKVAVISH